MWVKLFLALLSVLPLSVLHVLGGWLGRFVAGFDK